MLKNTADFFCCVEMLYMLRKMILKVAVLIMVSQEMILNGSKSLLI